MTGSVALDVVIGLVFIYLLYSLLATILCEMISVQLGMRARNLQQAIRRMLEDSPQADEVKVVAFIRNIVEGLIRLFAPQEGPSTCVFYHLPSVKYLARNTYHSRPSYITRQNFSKAMMEIFRRYGGKEDMTDLQKIQNVLKGALEYPGVLKIIKDEIVKGTTFDPSRLDNVVNYIALRDALEKIVSQSDTESLDRAQRKLFWSIKKILSTERSEKKDKIVVYKIDEMLNLFGHETRNHLTSLLRDSENDLVKFRFHIEQWFDDTMDRATGWYKQKIQFVLLIIGLVMAVLFNANTFVIVKKLSVDTDARDKLVQMATEYINDPINKLPEGVGKFSSKDSLKIDSLRKVRLDSLEKVRVRIQKEMDDANTLLALGWTDLPDSLRLLPIDSMKNLDAKKVVYEKILLDNDKSVLLLHDGYVKNAILSTLDETSLFGEKYTGYDKEMTRIDVDTSWRGYAAYSLGNLFTTSGWGFLLTAFAISLGAPFWFDMLNKLVQIRGMIREPTKGQSDDAKSSAASTSDPAHTVNRKG